MRAVIQRVRRASVSVDGCLISEITKGLCVFLGIEKGDNASDIDYIAGKIFGLRIFEDDTGKMNLALSDISSKDVSVLLVSQFTLLGDVRRGRRPSFSRAENPDIALDTYEAFSKKMQGYEITLKEGVFRAMMDVELINDGPVTILLDSKKTF
ncbi:MAG: D-tyrosyl-tRNA(Tyr) deacylase [Deltaproteobacteria bacterium]|nr:D-tyrosyl-tRNA(Tyr) deacylase [Deltaproteobacteria bacterium]